MRVGTVAFGQLLLRDGVVLRRVQLDGDFGGEVLGLGLVFDHFEGGMGEAIGSSGG